MDLLAVDIGDAAGQCVHVALVDDHTHGTGEVCYGIDKYESTVLVVAHVGVEEDGLCGGYHHAADFVEVECLAVVFLQGIDIHTVLYLVDARLCGAGAVFDIECCFNIHFIFVHPYQVGFEVAFLARGVVRVNDHLAAGDIDLIVEGEGDGLWREGVILVAVAADDAVHSGAFPGWHHHYLIAFAHDS